jgi:hypothetical protein
LWCWWGSGTAGVVSSTFDSRRRRLVAALALFWRSRGGASCSGVCAGRDLAAPFIYRARGGETSWAAGAALRVKRRASRAEGARGSGSVSRRSSWHAIGGSLPRGQCELRRGRFRDRAVGLGEAKWCRRPGGAAVVRQGGRGLRRKTKNFNFLPRLSLETCEYKKFSEFKMLQLS